MPTAAGRYPVPYGPDGSLLLHARGPAAATWRENVPFAARLRFDRFERGCSGSHAVWADAQGRRYPMFLTELAELLRAGTALAAGGTDALWVVVKRGSNYGLRLAGPDRAAAAGGGA